MKHTALTTTVSRAVLSFLVMASGLLAATMPAARADSGNPPPFDLTDAFYLKNGVNPAMLQGRPTGDGRFSVVDDAPDGNHRDIRMLFTLPAYDTSGGMHFFTVLGDLQPGAFTQNKAGRQAQKLAEQSPVYVFPVKDGDPFGVGNNRQAIWVHIFVNWTPRAFNSAEGHATLKDLAAKNGLALDGTPIINNKSQIDDLLKKGLVTLKKRPTDQTGRYFICPVLEDPRNGAIAKDAFLLFVADGNGKPLPAEKDFVTNFESLRTTGDWAK
jgi:hypothetical protein